MQQGKKIKVLLIGWDAADRKVLQPLLQQGRMPHLQKIISGGAYGSIRTLDPPLSPMLWTSIATGKTADKHGILGFIEPDPVTSEPRPAAVTSRNCKAIWNILCQNGYRTNVIGWWPSHPAEPVNGTYVSNMFSKSDRGERLMPGTVHPSQETETLKACRVFAEEISIADLLPFVPGALEIDQQKDKHLHNLASLLANCRSICNAAKLALQREDWDFSAVYFDTIDQCSHTFMKFYPPKMEGVPEEYFRLYQEVIPQMYVEHDRMLGEMMQLAGPDVYVIVLSDHGFYSDHLRPVRLPNDPASPALEHSAFGVLCMSGPQIKEGSVIQGASLLDITPTVLHLYGLPVGEDMDGTVLQEVMKEQTERQALSSWEDVAGNSGMHEKGRQDNSWQSTAAMFQMMELGYIDRLNSDKEKTLRNIVDESNYYLARVLMSKEEYRKALVLLEELYHKNGNVFRYAMRLLACFQHLLEVKRAEDLLMEIKRKFPREERTVMLAEAIMRCLYKGTAGLEMLNKLEESIRHLPELYVMIGNEYASLDDYRIAAEQYKKALALDEENVKALQGLSYVMEQDGQSPEEIDRRLKTLTREKGPQLTNYLDGINDLDLNPDRSIDFRRYQLVIRLFLEQFHKGTTKIS